MKFIVTQTAVSLGTAGSLKTNIDGATTIGVESDFVCFRRDGQVIAMFPCDTVHNIISDVNP
jgi:hypothetical protein